MKTMVALALMGASFLWFQQNSANVKSSTTPHHVQLSWIPPAASHPEVVYITIYRGVQPGEEIKRARVPVKELPRCPEGYRRDANCFTDDEVTPGMTYYYQLTSTDADGKESAKSEEVQASVPKERK